MSEKGSSLLFFISDKGKPAERLVRKEAGLRQTDLGKGKVRDEEAHLHK